MTKNFLKILSLATLCLMVAAPAHANDDGVLNQYDPNHRPSFFDEKKPGMKNKEDEIHDDSGLTSSAPYQVEFVRLDGAEAGDVTLRVISPGTVTGCIDVTQPKAEVKKTGRSMKIEITDGRLVPDTDRTAYTQHGCAVKTGSASVDITLKREDLISDRINKIMLTSKKMGAFLTHDLKTDEEKAFFTADLLDLANMGLPYKNGVNKTVYWFYPENTLVLFNSTIKMTDENVRKVILFAKGKGLTPLPNILPDFRTTKKNKNKLYFVDSDGIFASQIDVPGTVVSLGQIELEDTFYGPEGAYQKTIKKSVFVKRPGLYE
jgi:hypothetical protein